jgi:hypothetical protein
LFQVDVACSEGRLGNLQGEGRAGRNGWIRSLALAVLLVWAGACGSNGPHTFSAPDLPLPAAVGLVPEVGEMRLFGSYTGAIEPGGRLTRDDGPTAEDRERAEGDDIVLSPRHQFGAAMVMRPDRLLTLSLDVGISRTSWTRPASGQQARRLRTRTLRAWRPGLRFDVPINEPSVSLALFASANFATMAYREDSRSCGYCPEWMPVLSAVFGAQAGVSPVPSLHVWTFGGVGSGWNEFPMGGDARGNPAEEDNDGADAHALGMIAFGLDVRSEHFYTSVSSQLFFSRNGDSRPFHAMMLRVGGQWTVGRWRDGN